MGIQCEINLFKKHPDNVYYPGGKVNGVVRYTITDSESFKNITVSLKGLGNLDITEYVYMGKVTYVKTYDNKETYVDIDQNCLQEKERDSKPAGTYEIPFNFQLPDNIPPSFKFNGSISNCTVVCKIRYYVRIKFERHGFFNLDKKFKTKIKVGPTMRPTLPTSPVSYGAQKKPFQPFWQKDRFITIQSTVENSVVSTGDLVKFSYQVENGTKLKVKNIKIELTQETTHKSNEHFPDLTDCVALTECEGTSVKTGDTQRVKFALDIPESVGTIQHSVLVTRNYFVQITAILPIPHRNVVLKLPIEVMDSGVGSKDIEMTIEEDDSPPSYYEAMLECKKGELE